MNSGQYVFAGKWIGADMSLDDRFAPVFRKAFSVTKEIAVAEICICGLGLFELKINGNLPDDSVLNPAHTQYNKTVLYRKFDISSFLREGENIITVELGHSFYNEITYVWKWEKAKWRSCPKFIADIKIEYKDGSVEIVLSDESWFVCKKAPTTENSIYLGETFDANNLEMNFDENAIEVSAPEGILKEQLMPPIRRIETFKPEKIEKISDNCYIVTAPEMITGWASLKINEPAGTQTVISYGERLEADGHIVIIGKGKGRDGNWWPQGYIQQDKFISNGNEYVFEPKFSYKGFKYVQIENYSSDLTEKDITLYRVANDVKIYSEFCCSDENINKLHKLMKTTLLNNFQGKPTDTPVWEKNGWLGDLNCAIDSIVYNFDIGSFLSSFIDTMADCFDEYGYVPVFAPVVDYSGGNSPVWNTVFVFATEALINFFGMTDYAQNLYPTLRRYAVNYIEEMSEKDWVWGIKGLSDWVAPIGGEYDEADPNDSEGAQICATAFVYAMLNSMANIARILGKAEDIDEYLQATEKIYSAFNENFYNEKSGIYETTFWNQRGTRTKYRQTSNLVPLAFGLVPDDKKDVVIKNLINDIASKDYHLDTGCVGTKFILPVLFDCGYPEIAFRILTQKSYPSWCFWIENSATTAWESWERTTRSEDHYFLGTYEEALFSHIAGIRNIRNGFKEFTLSPAFDCGLEWVRTSFDLPHGKLSVNWKKLDDGTFTADFNIPLNSTANTVLSANGGKYTTVLNGGKHSFTIDKNGNVTVK